jgi:hypothetical protein
MNVCIGKLHEKVKTTQVEHNVFFFRALEDVVSKLLEIHAKHERKQAIVKVTQTQMEKERDWFRREALTLNRSLKQS